MWNIVKYIRVDRSVEKHKWNMKCYGISTNSIYLYISNISSDFKLVISPSLSSKKPFNPSIAFICFSLTYIQFHSFYISFLKSFFKYFFKSFFTSFLKSFLTFFFKSFFKSFFESLYISFYTPFYKSFYIFFSLYLSINLVIYFSK